MRLIALHPTDNRSAVGPSVPVPREHVWQTDRRLREDHSPFLSFWSMVYLTAHIGGVPGTRN